MEEKTSRGNKLKRKEREDSLAFRQARKGVRKARNRRKMRITKDKEFTEFIRVDRVNIRNKEGGEGEWWRRKD